MKKRYFAPICEVTIFNDQDVVMASGAEFDVSDFFGGVL